MDNPNTVFSTSPVAMGAVAGDPEAVELLVLPECIKINLRGSADNAAFVSAIEKSTGLSLPVNPNTKVGNDSAEILWLGPDEWQWRHTNHSGNELGTNEVASFIADFESHLAGIRAAVVDISDYYMLFCLEGPKVFAVLGKGTPLNLRQALGHSGQCAQTRFGNAAVLLDRQDSREPKVHIQVRWSYAEYLWQYLSEAMQEFT